MIIVSLALSAHREAVAYYVIESLLRQRSPPDEIRINLSSESYLSDEGFGDCPAWIEDLDSSKLRINWVANTGPYRKFNGIEEIGSEDCFITVDDDVLYGPGWLSGLLECAREHPHAIVCGRARRPKYNWIGGRTSYRTWSVVRSSKPATELVPTGNGGVLYRKELIDAALLARQERIELAPAADDLWMKLCHFRVNTPVVVNSEAAANAWSIQAGMPLFWTNVGARTGSSDRSARRKWVASYVLSYLGLPVGDNDRVIRELTRYHLEHEGGGKPFG